MIKSKPLVNWGLLLVLDSIFGIKFEISVTIEGGRERLRRKMEDKNQQTSNEVIEVQVRRWWIQLPEPVHAVRTELSDEWRRFGGIAILGGRTKRFQRILKALGSSEKFSERWEREREKKNSRERKRRRTVEERYRKAILV